MATRVTATPFTDEDLLGLVTVLRRVVAARVADGDGVEDVVQETLSRILEARWRLDRDALASYAIVTARNLITSRERESRRDRRHRHRLVEAAGAPPPEEVALLAEEYAAMSAALERIGPEEQQLLVAHEVQGRSVAKLAADLGETPGGVAARLTRARHQLRVEHVLAFRRADLPSTRCRPVLLSLTAGDRRRQRELGAERHLLRCGVCADLSPSLVQRRRGLAAIAPIGLLLDVVGRVPSAAREHPVQATALGGAAVAGAVAAAVLASPGQQLAEGQRPVARASAVPSAPAASRPREPVSAAAPAGSIRSGGADLLPVSGGTALRGYAGQRVSAYVVPVQSVPADEGFWVGSDARRRIFVQLVGEGESAVRVRPGVRVTFTGAVTANPAGFPERLGVSTAEGAAQLRKQGVRLVVDQRTLRAAG